MLKITSAKVIVTCPGRNFVTLKIETSDGVTGLGDATLNGRELAVASYLNDHVIPCLIGRDAHRIEDTWQYFYRGAYWRRGPVTMAAIAAVDTALWDIKAKVAGLPLYQLLGGASREGVLVYCHANGKTITETVAQAKSYLGMGYKAVRLQSGIPGLASTYGVSKDKLFYEPADADIPTENVWSTEKYLRTVPELFKAARQELGWDVHLLHDIHHRLTPIEAGRLGKDLEPYRPFWLEDAVVAENQANFRLVRQHTTTPLAVGEIFNSIWDCKQLIEEQSIDYIRATVVHAGGITHLRRIAALAELHNVRTGCHGATDLSPVCMSAALHFDLSIPNFGIQEYMRHTAETDAVFPHAYRFEAGSLIPGAVPGLGVEIDEALAAKYPYKRAYLPVNRLEDGTTYNWSPVCRRKGYIPWRVQAPCRGITGLRGARPDAIRVSAMCVG
jgi:mannonate dehydratase